MKTALITGVNGQDGSYLAELLLSKGYRVVGTLRNNFSDKANIRHLIGAGLELVYHEATEPLHRIIAVIEKVWPDEIYNLAGITYQKLSWDIPTTTFEINALFVQKLIEAIWMVNKNIAMFQASAASILDQRNGKCTEESLLAANTPYDVSKVSAHLACQVFRKRGLKLSTGILFSHESPRRGPEMVSRKISMAAANWKLGHDYPLQLGNIKSRKDWGYAPDYVEMMWKSLQVPPDDFVIGTGHMHTVEEFLNKAADIAGVDLSDVDVKFSQELVRSEPFQGAPSFEKAKEILEWNPDKTKFDDLVGIMVNADVERLVTGDRVDG